MKKILIAILFMVICSPAFAIKVGKVDSDLENYMQVVYDSGELTAAVTDLTVSGLSGDVETYEIIMRPVHNGSGGTYISLIFNGDYSDNYGYQFMGGVNALAYAIRDTTQIGFVLNDCTVSGQIAFSDTIISCGTDLSVTGISMDADSIRGTTVENIYSRGSVWNSTDPITSMTFHSYAVDGIGIGSRIIILRKVPDNDTGMRVGDLDIQGRVLGQWELVYEADFTEAATNLTISGLDGDKDVLYKMNAAMVGNYNGGHSQVFRFNLDSSVNYGYQYIYGENSSVVAYRAAEDKNNFFARQSVIGGVSLSETLIYAKSGYVRPYLSKLNNDVNGTTVGSVLLAGTSWGNPTDNITSMYIYDGETNGIGIGSHIEIWKLNLSEGDE